MAGWLHGLGLYVSVTRRMQHRPGIATDNIKHDTHKIVYVRRVCVDLMRLGVCPCVGLLCLLRGCYTEKAPNAWHRRGTHKRQETPANNLTDRQPTHLTDQAPSTIERAARETHNTN